MERVVCIALSNRKLNCWNCKQKRIISLERKGCLDDFENHRPVRLVGILSLSPDIGDMMIDQLFTSEGIHCITSVTMSV